MFDRDKKLIKETALKLYELYPVHVAKKAAIAKIEKALLRLPEENAGLAIISERGRADWMERRVREFAESPAGTYGGLFKDYSPPYPATWFNQARYLDDPREWGVRTHRGACEKHPQSGLTQKGNCYGCYAEENGVNQ